MGNGEGGENVDHPAQEEGDGERKPYVAHLPSEREGGCNERKSNFRANLEERRVSKTKTFQ